MLHVEFQGLHSVVEVLNSDLSQISQLAPVGTVACEAK